MKMPKSFLDEEVRCGFMIPTQIKQFWAAEIEVLGEIDRICKKYEIQYFADWGTLLGAVRHGGFVPWDDDLDIVMKREDYQKFLRVAKDEMQDGYCVQTYMDMKPEEWQFMGKVMSSERACFEPNYMRRFHNFPFIACVDVFVLDYAYTDEKKENRRRELCLFLLAFAEAVMSGRIKGKQIEKVIDEIHSRWQLEMETKEDPIEMGRYIYSLVEEQFASCPKDESEYLCQLFPWGLKGTAPLYDKKLYETSLRLPFEYTDIPVPLDFDCMLRERYGNYFIFDISGGAHDYPCFETQKKNFYDSLGMREKRYEFAESEVSIRERTVEGKESFKEIISQCLDNIGIPQTIEKIVEYQQTAIELGNLIESVKGNGCNVISYIEKYCEELYAMYEASTEDFVRLSEVEYVFMEMRKAINEEILEKRVTILMPSCRSHWNKLENVYKSLIEDKSNDVIVWPLERYWKDYDGTLTEKIEENYNFSKEINVIESERSIELLELLHPEEIIFTDGYDQWRENISVNPAFYSDNLIKCTDKLTYVCPYEIADFDKNQERAYRNMDYYVTVPGVVRADEIVVKSENIKKVYIEKLNEFCGVKNKINWERNIHSRNIFGAIDYNLNSSISQSENGENEKGKMVLYCINLGRIVGLNIEILDSLKQKLNILKNSKGVNLRVCFYPSVSDDMRKNVDIQKYLLEVTEYCEVREERFEDIEVSEVDAYYGDGSPYVVDMIARGKPVMIQNYK